MQPIIKLLLMAILGVVVPAHAGCHYGEKNIAIGDTISIQDPVLVKDYRQAAVARGLSPQTINKNLKSSDWTYIVLRCTRTYRQPPLYQPTTANKPAAMIQYSAAALVPVSHQVAWIEKMKGLSNGH